MRTSFKGFNFTGLGAFFSGTSTPKAGDCETEPLGLDFFAILAALRFLRDGRTRVRPDLVVAGLDEASWLCEDVVEGRDPSIGLCTQMSF